MLGSRGAILLFLGLLLFGGLGLYGFLVSSPLYRVKEIIVKGNQQVTRTEVIRWASLETKGNIFRADIRGVVAQLKQHPWVKGVVVTRILPDRLAVTVEERIPFARLSGPSSVYLLDEDGVVLQEIEGKKGANATLPEMVGTEISHYSPGQSLANPRYLRGLEVLKHARRCPWALQRGILRIELFEKQGPVALLKGQRTRICFGKMDPAVAWTHLQSVSSYLEGDLERIEQIDLSFESQVVVRYAQPGR